MLRKRLSLVAGISLFCIVFGVVIINFNAINEEITDFKTGQSLGEAKKEFLNATLQVPLEVDSLILSEIEIPYIPDDRPECIVSYSYQVFEFDNNYDVTRSTFVENLVALGWRPSRTEFTPDVQVNFLSPNERLGVWIFPWSEFERFKIDIPQSSSNDANLYAIFYEYKNPNGETCFLAD